MQQITTEAAAAPAGEFVALMRELDSSRETREGAVLDAMVVDYDGSRVSLDAGLKSRSVLSAEEFRNDEGEIDVKLGEFVKVKVELLDDGRGNTRLSHLQYRREQAWKQLVEAKENETIIEGYVRERVKGGYSVIVGGLRTFLPGSLSDLFPVRDGSLEGCRERFYVERLKEDRMSAILNRRLVRERELLGADLSKVTFKVGDVFKGTVVAIIDYPEHTAFVNIGAGIHGRLHRNDVSWQRINNISDILNLDEEIEVVVTEINTEENRLTLSAKELQKDPWQEVEQTHPVGSRIYGRVTSIQEYGAFVEIEKGIEGLVHVSEMNWLDNSTDPHKIVSVNDEIEVQMLGFDLQKRRISLGLKQCRPNPWEEFGVIHRKGAKLQGKIAGLKENIGLFVDLPGGITGLVHMSNLSYTGDSRAELEKYHKGQDIEVHLLNIDVEKQRISLGIKQLGIDPYDKCRKYMTDRTQLEVEVVKIVAKGAEVALEDGITGFIPIGEISEERIDTPEDKLKVGQKVQATIINVEKRHTKMSVILSIKAKDSISSKEAIRRHKESVAAEDSKQDSAFGAMVSKLLGEQQGEEDSDASESAAADSDAADSAGDDSPASPDADDAKGAEAKDAGDDSSASPDADDAKDAEAKDAGDEAKQ